MSVIYILLSISILVAILFFAAFVMSVRSGQYDDSYTPSVRMLFEDELVKSERTRPSKMSAPAEIKKETNQAVEPHNLG